MYIDICSIQICSHAYNHDTHTHPKCLKGPRSKDIPLVDVECGYWFLSSIPHSKEPFLRERADSMAGVRTAEDGPGRSHTRW